MPFEIVVLQEADLLVNMMYGVVTADVIERAVEEAVENGVYRPGMDRITLSASDAKISQLDLSALERIQSRMMAYEMEHSQSLQFRSAFVSDFVGIQPIMKLYAALWQKMPGVQAEFEVFDSVPTALRWLGRPEYLDLPIQID